VRRTKIFLKIINKLLLSPLKPWYIKGKSAIAIARRFGGRARNFTGEVFWARGYFMSTVGVDEARVRAYIRSQEQADERYDQMQLGR
jgi:putative transposase